MKSVTRMAPRRNSRPYVRHAVALLRAGCLTALLGSGACADDLAPAIGNVDAGPDVMDVGTAGVEDAPLDMYVPFDLPPPPTEPPLTIPVCPTPADTGATCCASALGFEDGSTSHFLPPTCCRMALSNPQVAATPTACGRASLRLDADFRATDANALCDQTGEAPACAFREGEVTRAVLAPLDLTALTVSAMVYLDGPALPAAPVHGTLFVLGRGGLIEGTMLPLPRAGAWTRLELRIADDGNAPGADIHVIGIRLSFHGQAWLGRAYVDEITWR